MKAGYYGKPPFEKLGNIERNENSINRTPKEYIILLQENISSQFCKKAKARTSFIYL
jgi:hypothetical protein